MSTVSPYHTSVMNYIKILSPHVRFVSQTLGVDAVAIIGAIAEEHNDMFTASAWRGPSANIFVDSLVVQFSSHSGILADYNYFVQNRSEISNTNIFNKLANPVLVDMGPGNIKLFTAIELLNDYIIQNPNSDPLNLKQYNSDFHRLALDLTNYVNPKASAAFAGLMIAEGVRFYETQAPTAWASATDEQRQAYLVTYYNRGKDKMNSLALEAFANGQELRPEAELGGDEHLQNAAKLKEVYEQTLGTPPRCFPAGTTVMLANGCGRAIEDIQVGDCVAAFESSTDLGRGSFTHSRVTRIFENVTQEFLKLRFADVFGKVQEQTVTPGHFYLNELGDFEAIDQLVDRCGRIVLADGSLAFVTAERIVRTSTNATLYAEAQTVQHEIAGALARAIEIECGWATYNFEVEHFHTYIAGGVRVHNDSEAWIDMAGALGQQLGSQLGSMLTQDENPFIQIAASSAIGTLTQTLAASITDIGFGAFTGGQHQINLGAQLALIDDRLQGGAIGGVSSFLTAELGEVLGLRGFGAGMFSSALNPVTYQATTQAWAQIARAGSLAGLANVDWGAALKTGITNIPGSLSSFFGSTLANEILPPTTLQGSIGGSLGALTASTLLSTALSGSLTTFGGILLPGVGAFFGTLLGTYLGDRFGEYYTDYHNEQYGAVEAQILFGEGRFTVDGVYAKNTDDDAELRDLMRSIGEAIADSGNAFLDVIGGEAVSNNVVTDTNLWGNDEFEEVQLLQSVKWDPTDAHNGREWFHWSNSNNSNSRSAHDDPGGAINRAIETIVDTAQVVGGDLLMKRAALRSSTSDIVTVTGDMSLAEDYAGYLKDREIINLLIAASPESAFAAG